MKRAIQSSESIELGIMLSLAGGFMDAYSYIMRGKVFANAQTGNILLLGVKISEGEFGDILHYLFPILFFTGGIAMASLMRAPENRGLHWRQLTVLVEMIILSVVAFIPLSMNLLANSMTSFACGIQVESFRKIHGRSAATTMCIGNLRSGMESLSSFMNTKDRAALINASHYFLVILAFALGAAAGSFLVSLFSLRAIWVSSFLLLISFLILHHERNA